MEPIKTIVSALVAGAVAATKDVGGKMIKDAYDGLKNLIARKLKDKPDSEKAVKQVEENPKDKDKQTQLAKELKTVRVDQDKDILNQAENLLQLLQKQGVISISKNQMTFLAPSAAGGIQARSIKADNVVEGAQIVGVDPAAAQNLVSLAKEIARGGIRADSIEAKNVVEGLQYIADPHNTTPDDLRREVGALRGNVEIIVSKGEIPDEGDVEYLKESLEKAEKELTEAKPKGSLIIRSLKNVTEILNATAETAQAAGSVQMEVIKLAPTAAMIYSIAQVLF